MHRSVVTASLSVLLLAVAAPLVAGPAADPLAEQALRYWKSNGLETLPAADSRTIALVGVRVVQSPAVRAKGGLGEPLNSGLTDALTDLLVAQLTAQGHQVVGPDAPADLRAGLHLVLDRDADGVAVLAENSELLLRWTRPDGSTGRGVLASIQDLRVSTPPSTEETSMFRGLKLDARQGRFHDSLMEVAPTFFGMAATALR
ncbi:MAG: hypothetical protein AAF533_24405 [Acidobacteriota bacterium]